MFRAAGYERGSYENCEIIFLGMENIHNVRKSYMRLRELCSAPADDDERWLQVRYIYIYIYIVCVRVGERESVCVGERESVCERKR